MQLQANKQENIKNNDKKKSHLQPKKRKKKEYKENRRMGSDKDKY